MLRQNRKLAALLTGMLLLVGCGAGQTGTEEIPEADINTENMISADAVWVAYWGQDDAEEQLAALNVQKVCLFEAYFDENNEPVVPQATQELAAQLKASDRYTLYLTFVNDIVSEEKGNSLKDTDLLYTVLGTEEDARRHALEILDIVEAYGLDGVEIDYERIRKDYELWDAFIRFLDILLPEADARGLAVRVLLEPGAPVEDLELPDGPEYVVMCYNLYGSGTDPGPKADREFLLSLKEKFGGLSNVGYALANGGYSWAGDGSVSSLTTSSAIALLRENDVTPSRDADNGALSFTYQEDGGKHTVWYGDSETLSLWSEILNENESEPVPVSIWRLNG